MNSKVELLTTTSSVEGWKIEKYLGVVTYQLVIGANIFHDVFSSFRDIFGGAVKGYQEDLKSMEEIALSNLKKKASKLGGNLILGLRLDFDEVSGGGKSMFMLSASGTAAFGKLEKEKSTNEQYAVISLDKLEYEIERDQFKAMIFLDSYEIHDVKEIEKLLEYKIEQVEKVITYIDNHLEDFADNKELIAEYFHNISMESISEILQSNLFMSIRNETLYELVKLLEIIGWYDYNVLYFLLRSNNSRAHIRVLYLLGLENKFYAKDDIKKLSQLIELMSKVYSRYPIVKTSKSILGKEKEEWECFNCGLKNPKESKICLKYECQANVFGIPYNKINPEKLKITFLSKINKLKQLLNTA